jgi:hypothetical protein
MKTKQKQKQKQKQKKADGQTIDQRRKKQNKCERSEKRKFNKVKKYFSLWVPTFEQNIFYVELS